MQGNPLVRPFEVPHEILRRLIHLDSGREHGRRYSLSLQTFPAKFPKHVGVRLFALHQGKTMLCSPHMLTFLVVFSTTSLKIIDGSPENTKNNNATFQLARALLTERRQHRPAALSPQRPVQDQTRCSAC